MGDKYKVIIWMFLSFALVLGIFVAIIWSLYAFSVGASKQFIDFLKNLPMDKTIAIGTMGSILFFISRKYQKKSVTTS